MAESPPRIHPVGESLDVIRRGVGDVTDIFRHEVLKDAVGLAISLASRTQFGTQILERASGPHPDSNRLETEIGGLQLATPTGIAAGWDKTAQKIHAWQALGASHVTPGAVSMYPQAGRRMPRLRTFDDRVGDGGTRVSLNAYGFNNPGKDGFIHNLARNREGIVIPVIAQVTVNKEFLDPDNRRMVPRVLAATARELVPYVDGVSVGISSPNTDGMRDAQDEWSYVRDAVDAVAQETAGLSYRGYKFDADGGSKRLDTVCRLAEEGYVSTLEGINTSALPAVKKRYGAEHLPGGLAGGDITYQDMAVQAIRYVYEQVGDKVDIMAMGGVGITNSSRVTHGDQAVRLLRAGASALGVNTGVRSNGAKAITLVDTGILDHLDTLPGSQSVKSIIGVDTERGQKAQGDNVLAT